MPARSSAVALLLVCGGCDLAFGVGGEQDPCTLSSFDGAHTKDITPALAFSVDWDQTFAVVFDQGGLTRQITLSDGAQTDIDLGLYMTQGLALAPEGNALFYTALADLPILHGALRRGPATWQLDAAVPRGTFAGTPSADVFGPRRVLVKMRPVETEVMEYEDQAGHWVVVGEPHTVPGDQAPNLTPNGLTAVYGATDADGNPAIYGMTRPSIDTWFGEPVQILAGDRTPQLLGKCHQLYTVHGDQLRRYDR